MLVLITPIPDPKNPIAKLIKYTIAIPPVAAAIPSLKFSLGFIKPDLYAINKERSIPIVRHMAFKTIPSYILLYIKEIPPNNPPSKIA